MKKLFLLFIVIIPNIILSQCCVSYNSLQNGGSLINTFYPVSGNVVVNNGVTSIPLGAVPINDVFGNSYGSTPINAGDLLLIVQMQGADFNAQSSNLYGAGITNSGPDSLGATGYTNLNNVGLYEYVIAQNSVPLSGGTLNFSGNCVGGGLNNSYINQSATANGAVAKKFQIVRVPKFYNLTLTSNVTTTAWNGSVGGIIVLDVLGTLDLNGFSIDASGKGFRGGYMNVRASGGNTTTVTTYDSNISSGKGEGICGTPRFMWDGLNQVDNGVNWIGYNGGNFGIGAPGNAGGGGNIHNAGGGGGGAGGAGGCGAKGVGSSILNGGRPGNSITPSVNKLFMGGGGGGGDANNALTGVKGGSGGGIIFVKCNSLIGNGTIISNGSNGQPGNLGAAPDGAGGGGAGGTIIIETNTSSSSSTLNLIARGGNGGNSLNQNTDYHGPGGGAGGGIIYYSSVISNVTVDVAFGNNGRTNFGNGISWGANNGTVGYSSTFTHAQFPSYLSNVNYPNPVADFNANVACIGSQTTFQNNSTINSIYSSSIIQYNWNFGDGTNSQVINPSHTYATAGSYSVTLTVTTNFGCINSITKTVTVNPKTAPTFTQVTPKCFGATLAALPTTSNNAITGTWSPLLNNNATTTYTFTPTTGVCATTATMTITVNPNVTPTFTQVNPICSGGTLAALPTTSTNGIIGNWSPALNNTATTTYTFTPTTGVCASTATMTIVVDTPSILNITNNNPNCNPNQLSWSNVNTINSSTAIASIGSNAITINNTSGGLFSTSNVFNGGIFPAQYNLPINNLTLANNLAGLFTFCFNTPVSNPQIAIASIGNSGLPVSINTSVPYQVIWAGPGMNFINNQSLIGQEGYCIIVFPGTHQCISFDYLTSENYCNIVFGTQDNNCQIEPLCLGNSVELVPHGATNVTWSPTNNLTFLPNSNNVIATPSQTTTYTATTNNSCQNQASITVTVNPNITPTFTQVSPICSGATVAALPTTSNNGITGTWSPAINNTATTTYTFTPTTGLCATTATMTITVNPKTTPIFTPVNPVCSGATLAALPTTSNNGIIGTWSPAVNNTATTTYTFTPTTGLCATTATTNVVITPLPTATITYAGSPFCSTLSTAQVITLTGTGAYTGGNYSSTAGLTINPTTGAITPSTSTPGSYVVTYTTLAFGGCSSVLVTTNVVITRIPTATISYSGSPFCSTLATAQAVTLTGTAAFTGGTYSSTIGLTINPTTGAITPSTSIPGNYVVTYSTLASSGCSSVTATTNVVITPLPTATINYIGSPFCSTLATAQAVTLTGTGAYTGGAYSSSIGLSINPTSGAITPSTSTPGSYVISYTIATAGGCSPVVTTTPIVINPIPVATATASANTICTLSSTNIVLTSDIVGTTYNWSVIQTNATGATNGSGASINQILTNSSFTSGTVDYQITPTANGCSGNAIQSTITVNPKPDVIANPSTQNICTGQPTSINLSGNVTGTTYNWTVSQVDVLGASPGSGNSIAQILNTNSTNFGIANYTIIPTSNSCIGNPIVVQINITPKPVIFATPPLQTICSGDTIVPINLSSSITGTTYNWSVSQTNVLGAINGSGSSIIQTLTNNTTIQRQALYTINSILNNCPGNSITAIVNVNPTPLVNSNTINQTICSNENMNISLTSTVSNTLFSWTVTQNNVTGALPGSGNNINQTLTNNTTITGLATYNVIPVAASCSGLPLLISVNVKPKPNLTSALNATICSMQTTNISLTSNIVGSTFTWTASTTGPLGFSNGQGNTIAQQLQNNANYYGTVTYDVTPTFNGCSNVPSSVKVKVNPLPKPNLVDGTICKDALGNTIRNYILDTGLSNINHSFNWNFNGTLIPNYFQNPYMATQIGVYSVFATNTSTGCRSNPVVTASITEVNPAIKLFAYVGNNLSGNSDITVIVQNGTGPFQYQLDNGIFQNSNVFTSVSPGQHTITVIDNYNCTNLITKTTVLDYPNYFTPNGDNYNDNWNIYGIQDQPFAKIFIYDRFGKLITQINPSGIGWDGNYNGSPLAATDYWFVVEYMEKDSNGITVWKTYKSHFSLIR